MNTQGFINHPCEVPVDIEVCEASDQANISCASPFTGIRVRVAKAITPGSVVALGIHLQQPPFIASGEVCCCDELADGYEVAIQFHCPETAYAVRMIEQVCHIEQYRQRVAESEGRDLSEELAAQEWIARHAAAFPALLAG